MGASHGNGTAPRAYSNSVRGVGVGASAGGTVRSNRPCCRHIMSSPVAWCEHLCGRYPPVSAPFPPSPPTASRPFVSPPPPQLPAPPPPPPPGATVGQQPRHHPVLRVSVHVRASASACARVCLCVCVCLIVSLARDAGLCRRDPRHAGLPRLTNLHCPIARLAQVGALKGPLAALRRACASRGSRAPVGGPRCPARSGHWRRAGR